MNIVTLTLNPAYDMHCEIDRILLHKENLAHMTDREAGGKGVNISRALTKNGVANLAFVVIGEENGEEFCRRLAADGMDFRSLSVAGRIRENLTLHETDADETRISFDGFSVDGALLARVEEAVLELLGGESVVTFTGRIPSGLDKQAVIEFLLRLKGKGAKLVIDSRSLTLDDLRTLGPWLIKPNQEEISAYLGREVHTFDEIRSAAEALHGQGMTNVMISLGAQGALLSSDGGIFVATPPRVDAKSTIGAGDSSIAGFLAAAAEGKHDADALCEAVAYGTAACLTSGTRPPLPTDVAWVRERVSLN